MSSHLSSASGGRISCSVPFRGLPRGGSGSSASLGVWIRPHACMTSARSPSWVASAWRMAPIKRRRSTEVSGCAQGGLGCCTMISCKFPRSYHAEGQAAECRHTCITDAVAERSWNKLCVDWFSKNCAIHLRHSRSASVEGTSLYPPSDHYRAGRAARTRIPSGKGAISADVHMERRGAAASLTRELGSPP